MMKLIKCLFIFFIVNVSYADNIKNLKDYIQSEYKKVYPEIDIKKISLVARSELPIYDIEIIKKGISSVKANNGYLSVNYKYNNKVMQETIKYIIEADINIYIANESIPTRSNFNNANFIQKTKDFSTIMGIPATKYEIMQSSAKVYIPENTIIYRNKLTKKILVQKDAEVKIIFKSDGIEAVSSGQALENGTKGDKIKIQNNESKRKIVAEVIDENTVFIK